ncbi:MAG: triose-phosphate isomerase [Nitrosopumilaceae archaeon]|nr:triose-phosphate isomerase [Nitrosopumilaceae archaeon]
MLVINCKNYAEVATAPRIRRLVRAADSVAAKLGVEVCVAPPQHMIGVAAEEAASIARGRRGAGPSASRRLRRRLLRILSQHVDVQPAGSTTGYAIPELLKAAGAEGSIINHSEHRIRPAEIAATIKRLRDTGMTSILCVRNVRELRKYAPLGPDYVAIEPPELIGSGRAVSTERPEIISSASRAVSEPPRAKIASRASASSSSSSTATTHTRPQLLCGAGVVSGADVAKAAELGSAGILVASGIIKRGPAQWRRAITDLAEPLSAR